MTVPQELQDKWQDLYSAGDFEAISRKSGISNETIRNSFNKGECSDKVFSAIAGFYKEKEEMIKEFL